MAHWICCNSCFQPPGSERKLAVTTCGHIICNACFQKGNQGECLICKAKCQVSPLTEKSSSEVKALFSDINTQATKHFTEISKVLQFQARHQKRLMTYYRERNEKLEETLLKMKQEMQQMSKKLSDQNAYIAKLESSLQHHSAKATAVSQTNHSSHPPCGAKSVLQIPYNSLSRHVSSTNLAENMDVDGRGAFRKLDVVPRLSLISPPQDGRMGTIPHRSSTQNKLANHSACSATVSRFPDVSTTPDISFGSSSWKSPVFNPPSAFRLSSLTSLRCPPR